MTEMGTPSMFITVKNGEPLTQIIEKFIGNLQCQGKLPQHVTIDGVDFDNYEAPTHATIHFLEHDSVSIRFKYSH